MKHSIILMAAAVLAGAVHGEVTKGDAYAAVLEQLGEPRGEIAAGEYRLLYYDRGKVELRGGKVSKVELVSAEQLERQRLVTAQRAAEAEKMAQEARARRILDGTALRKARLADVVFMRSSPDERVAFWQGFKRSYPEVALGDEYTAALNELEQQLAETRVEQQRQAQVDALEQRVANAEDRARRAERRSSFVYSSYCPPVYAWMPECNYGTPVAFTPTVYPSHRALGPASGITTYGPYLRSAMALPGLQSTYSSERGFSVTFGTRP